MFFDGDCLLSGGAVYLPSIDVLLCAAAMDFWIKLARETHVIEYSKALIAGLSVQRPTRW